ncbi:MAG: selenium-binding family protein [Actinomycetota bacterium]|nr:selenium-binding family protein [Actinomycetota bacterium]
MTHDQHSGPGYTSPQEAMRQPPEQFVYVACLYEGTGVEEPDFLAVVDTDPESATYSEVVERLAMPNAGDELHHFGWNACSSACHSDIARDTLIIPGFRSSRLHIVDVSEPRRPQIRKVIEADELARGCGYSGPHTVHCMPGDIVTVSMLGDPDGNAPGGFAALDAKDFSVLGRWEEEKNGQELMYDFWYQPRHNTLVSSEWAAPNTFSDGFDPADVAAGRYGHQLHFWDLERRAKVQTLDLGEEGMIPLEIRWQHDPAALQGFVGAALSSNIMRFHKPNGSWAAETVIDVANEELDGWPLEGGVPGLITDLVLSMDDRDLFFSNWLHGDLRHYDVSDPTEPKLRSQVWLGGLLGRDRGHPGAGGPLNGGPQMLQCSLDGERVYVSNSLYSTWDNQFYPGLRGWLTKLERQADGTYALDPDFFVDFTELDGAPRPHEIHLPAGDCTTEIFL